MSEFIWTITCQKCGCSHAEGSEEAQFIALNGACEECDLSVGAGTGQDDGE